jgi:hypothetical protein
MVEFDKRILAFSIIVIAIGLLSAMAFYGVISFGGKGALLGGSVVNVQTVDYTNDPSVPFTKVWTANVILDGGGNYLAGVTSPSVQGKSQDGQTASKEKFTVNFKLNSLYCAYPLKTDKNTLSFLTVKSAPQRKQLLRLAFAPLVKRVQGRGNH